jgi:single-strand DNA-binding protein
MTQAKGTINRVELLGWLGADPELRFMPSGTAVCRLRIATKRSAGQGEDGQRAYETEWTNVEVWDRLAEVCGNRLQKGSRVLVTGSLRTDSWQDRETGQTRWKTYVRAEGVLFLDGRPESAHEDEAESQAASEDVSTDIPF